jgi:protein gp37
MNMAIHESGIDWTHYSGNSWIGCTEVGPGCTACYARAMMATRLKRVAWGPRQPRLPIKGFASKVEKANREAIAAGQRKRFFINPHSDLFDNEVPDDWREETFAIMKAAGALDFIMVTKRIGNAPRMLPADWGPGYTNAWLLATMVNQQEVDRDMQKFAEIPAIVRGISIEPIMGRIDLTKWLGAIDWVIIGGQSAQVGGVTPLKAEYLWVRDLIDQCLASDVAVYFKQWGSGAGVRGGHEIDGHVIRQFPLSGVRRCLTCGCHDFHACVSQEGCCRWAEPARCSQCVAKKGK